MIVVIYILTVSAALNIIQFCLYVGRGNQLKLADRYKRMYRYLVTRLQHQLKSWESEEYCRTCKQWAGRHTLDCPVLTVSFAITKSEQEQ